VSYLVDANILVYGAMRDRPHHSRARKWLECELTASDGFAGRAWVTLCAFGRIVSNRRIMGETAVAVPAEWSAAEA
jgi:predicted nucleic acid-binding protein